MALPINNGADFREAWNFHNAFTGQSKKEETQARLDLSSSLLEQYLLQSQFIAELLAIPADFQIAWLPPLSDDVTDADYVKARFFVEQPHRICPFSIGFGDHVGSSQAAPVAVFLARNEVLSFRNEAILLLASKRGPRKNECCNERNWQNEVQVFVHFRAPYLD